MRVTHTPSTLFLKHSILNFHKCTPYVLLLHFTHLLYQPKVEIPVVYPNFIPNSIPILSQFTKIVNLFGPIKVIDPLVHPPLVFISFKRFTIVGELLGLRNV